MPLGKIIKVPKIRDIKTPKEISVPKPRGITKPPGKKIAKGITDVDILKAKLLEAKGNRSAAASKLEISDGVSRSRARHIRQMSDSALQTYADKLGITVEEIRRICAPNAGKGVTRLDIIQELLKTRGNKTKAAENLGISFDSLFRYAEDTYYMADAKLTALAKKLGTTVNKIKTACLNRGDKTYLKTIDIIGALIEAKGNKTEVSKKFRISIKTVNNYIKRVRNMSKLSSESILLEFAKLLGVTVQEIKDVIEPRMQRAKKIFFEK